MREIYDAIFAAIDAATAIPVLGHVPENYETFPYIKVNPLENGANDTDTESGFLSTIQIEIYSRYRGLKEVSDLQFVVYNALHKVALPDTISYGFSTIQQEFSNILTESDDLTRVGVQRFNVIFEPLP